MVASGVRFSQHFALLACGFSRSVDITMVRGSCSGSPRVGELVWVPKVMAALVLTGYISCANVYMAQARVVATLCV